MLQGFGTSPHAFVNGDYLCNTGAMILVTHHSSFPSLCGMKMSSVLAQTPIPHWLANLRGSSYRQLPQATSDDMKMSVCRDEDASNEDIAIEIVAISFHIVVTQLSLHCFVWHSFTLLQTLAVSYACSICACVLCQSDMISVTISYHTY